MQTLKPDGSGRPVLSGGIHGGPANHATGVGAITGSARGELLTVVYELLDVCVHNPLLAGISMPCGVSFLPTYVVVCLCAEIHRTVDLGQ